MVLKKISEKISGFYKSKPINKVYINIIHIQTKVIQCRQKSQRYLV